MIWKKEIKTTLRVIFILLQLSLIMIGFGTVMILLPVYYRINAFVSLSVKSLCPAILAGVLSITSGILGYTSLRKKKKVHFFLFILSLASLMNLEVLLALFSNRLVDDNKLWLNNSWTQLSNSQKNIVQDHLACCGLETINDRAGSICNSTIPCLKKFNGVARSIRNAIQTSIVCFFFLETLGLAIISFLKFGK